MAGAGVALRRGAVGGDVCPALVAAVDRHELVVGAVQPDRRDLQAPTRGDRLEAGAQREEGGPREVAVPDELVGLVGAPDVGVTAQGRDVDRRRRDLVEVGQGGRLPRAEHRAGEHRCRERLGVALGVAGGDHAAHRVADEHERQVGVLYVGTLHEQVQVVDDPLEVLDQHPLALAAPVADVVVPVDDGAVGGEPLGHPLVAPDVLAVAVRDDRDPRRVAGRAPLRADEQAGVALGVDVLGRDGAHGVLLRGVGVRLQSVSAAGRRGRMSGQRRAIPEHTALSSSGDMSSTSPRGARVTAAGPCAKVGS